VTHLSLTIGVVYSGHDLFCVVGFISSRSFWRYQWYHNRRASVCLRDFFLSFYLSSLLFMSKFWITTSYRSYYLHIPRDATGQFIFAFKKKLRSKSVRFFCKVIPNSLRFGCNTWPKSNIYNINNNIKLGLTLSIKVSGLQYQTQ